MNMSNHQSAEGPPIKRQLNCILFHFYRLGMIIPRLVHPFLPTEQLKQWGIGELEFLTANCFTPRKTLKMQSFSLIAISK